jgi:hypothetical protein
VETLKYCPVKQACWNKEQIPQAKDSGKRKGQKRKLGKQKIEIRLKPGANKRCANQAKGGVK